MVREGPIATTALALLAATLLAVASGHAGPRRFAVVVGANHGAAEQVRLHHAERDARKVAEVLLELGGVRAADLTLLVDGPTAPEVMAALRRIDEMAEAVRKRGGDTIVVLYYSGHATPGYLELSGTRLPIRLVRKQLEQSPAKVRLAILDACHSGTAVRGKGGKRTKKRSVAFSVDGTVATEGYAILTSSAAGEESQESDEILGSFFTHHLVSGLRGAADADTDDQVTLGEAYRYAYGRTLEETAGAARRTQHPNVDLALRGGMDVVLTSLRQAQATLRLPAGEEAAQWVVFEPGSGLVVLELLERPGRMVTVAVPAGELDVYRRAGVQVARGRVVARAGSDLTLDRDRLTEIPLTAYLTKGEAGIQLAAMVGAQTFLSSTVRSSYVAPAPLFTVELAYTSLFARGLDLSLDVAFTSGTQHDMIEEGGTFHQRLTQVQVGTKLAYRFDFGALSLSLGPRVALFYLGRDTAVGGSDVASDHVVTVAVGPSVGFWWRAARRLSVGVDARVSYVPLPIEDLDGNQWLVETQAAAALHF